MRSLLPESYTKAVLSPLPPGVKKMLRAGRAQRGKAVLLKAFPKRKSQERAVPAPQDDWMLALFLNFLGRDAEQTPHRVQPVTADLLARIDALVGDEDIDINTPLLPEDDD